MRQVFPFPCRSRRAVAPRSAGTTDYTELTRFTELAELAELAETSENS